MPGTPGAAAAPQTAAQIAAAASLNNAARLNVPGQLAMAAQNRTPGRVTMPATPGAVPAAVQARIAAGGLVPPLQMAGRAPLPLQRTMGCLCEADMSRGRVMMMCSCRYFMIGQANDQSTYLVL